MAKAKKDQTPIEVGDWVKVKLSGLGSEAYQVEEIHYKENKKGELVLDNYTVVLNEVGTNGHYQHRLGQNGTMFATGKKHNMKTNLKTRLVKI